MRSGVPLLLSFNGGYVDTAGFLALQGLFTAHVTGNFVTLGAAVAYGASGIVAKLLALPVFCVTVLVARWLTLAFPAPPRRSLLALLIGNFVFLAAGGVAALQFGPFAERDGWHVVLTGMLLVIGMAVQNAAHRIYLGAAPPSTLMTGTTTQMMIDAAGYFHGGSGEAKPAIAARFRRLLAAVLAFAGGCGLAAILFIQADMWCFAVPPVVVLAAVVVLMTEAEI
ncbi:DUF1275 domain-containing protein [bacterium]|nr:DUF1275 domain-containing protein [bacterium]